MICKFPSLSKLIKVKCSGYRPGVTQRVVRVIALLFHGRGTRRGWVVSSSTPRPHFTPGKDPVPIVQEAGWGPMSIWTGGKSRPHQDSIPDLPARSQSLYWLSYPANKQTYSKEKITESHFNVVEFTTLIARQNLDKYFENGKWRSETGKIEDFFRIALRDANVSLVTDACLMDKEEAYIEYWVDQSVCVPTVQFQKNFLQSTFITYCRTVFVQHRTEQNPSYREV